MKADLKGMSEQLAYWVGIDPTPLGELVGYLKASPSRLRGSASIALS